MLPVEVVDVLTDEVCLEHEFEPRHAPEAVPRAGDRLRVGDAEYRVEEVVYHWAPDDDGRDRNHDRDPRVEVRVTVLTARADRA